MPTITKFGDRLTTALADDGRVTSRTSVTSARPAIQADYWARNSLHPDARLASAINEAANQAVLYRTREVFRAGGILSGSTAWSNVLGSFGAGDRARYRFAFRTGPYAHGLGVIVAMVESDTSLTSNTYARLDIANGAGSVVASQTFVYGIRPTDLTESEQFQSLKQIMGFVDGLSSDTEYYGTFYDVDNGRLQSACVFELPSLTENGGYLSQTITTHSAILDIHRQYPAEVSNALLQKAGSQVFNYTVDKGTEPRSNATSTLKNVIDDTVTTVSASSPGYTLDMTNKARLSQSSGVPVTMKVYAASSGSGIIKLLNSAGATVMSITGGWVGAPAWQSVTGYLPASQDKYDLQFSNNGSGTFDVYAVSVYEYG